MTRFLLLALTAAAPMSWSQVEGPYRYASLSVKPGAAFEARVRSGVMQLPARAHGRFEMDHPAAPGTPLALAASLNGNVLAGTSASGGAMDLFVALRAPAAGQPAASLAAGDWSAVMISMAGGKPRGLVTAFLDFRVSRSGAISDASMISHEAAVDDVSFAETLEWKPDAFEIGGIPHEMFAGAGGEMFLAIAPGQSSLVIGLRRDRDATTMVLQGFYALSEIGARNSFSFTPDRARFFSTRGTLHANAGLGRLSQRVTLADSSVEFEGAAAYMVTSAGAGTFSPRLEQRRRNLAVSGDGHVWIAAQVSEPGQLSLLHGIGVGIRLLEPPMPSLAARAHTEGNVVSLYGRDLGGVQVTVDGQPAQTVQAWPNQIDVRLAQAPAAGALLRVELTAQGRKAPPVAVTLDAGPIEFASAPAAAGGFLAPLKPAHPGDTIEVTITGAPPPRAGLALLFDGLAGKIVSAAPTGGATRYKVTLPKTLAPSPQVSVALSTAGFYADLGDIAVARPPATPAATATH